MKLIKFTLLFFCVAGLLACRKNTSDPDIKQYDEDQIKAYIAANGLTGMKRDANDTTGIYYQVLTPGTGPKIEYYDRLSLVYTVKSVDGRFIASDTISNHVYDYVGHFTSTQGHPLVKGLMLSIVDILKFQGTRARILVPSRLAYGVNGGGTGSSSSNTRIAGNQCLEYYVNLVAVDGVADNGVKKVGLNDQAKYDSVSLVKYMAANSFTGYTPLTVKSEGRNFTMYYKVTQAGSGGTAIGPNSVVELQYTSRTLNNAITSDSYNTSDGSGVSADLGAESRVGLAAGLQKGKVGDKLSLLMPSQLVYGKSAYSTDLPANSCLRYDFNIISVD